MFCSVECHVLMLNSIKNNYSRPPNKRGSTFLETASSGWDVCSFQGVHEFLKISIFETWNPKIDKIWRGYIFSLWYYDLSICHYNSSTMFIGGCVFIAIVRDDAQNTTNPAISFDVNNVIPLLIGPSFSFNNFHYVSRGRENPAVSVPCYKGTDTNGLPSPGRPLY